MCGIDEWTLMRLLPALCLVQETDEKTVVLLNAPMATSTRGLKNGVALECIRQRGLGKILCSWGDVQSDDSLYNLWGRNQVSWMTTDKGLSFSVQSTLTWLKAPDRSPGERQKTSGAQALKSYIHSLPQLLYVTCGYFLPDEARRDGVRGENM